MPTVRLRRHLPALVAVVLVVLCLFSFAFVCVCAASDHPGQAIEQALGSIPAAIPPVLELWSLVVLALLVPAAFVGPRRFAFGRASPAALQRFLF